MATLSTGRRPAFTLLEILLALVIGVLLLGALYVAVGLHLRHAQIARSLVAESALARAIFDRMASDIRQTLAPPPPAPASGGGGAAAASSSGNNSGGTTAASASPSSTSSSPSSSSSSSTSPTSTSPAGGVVNTTASAYNVGVQGDASHLSLCTGRALRVSSADQLNQPMSTLRRITYWYIDSGAGSGLARQEIPEVTSDDVTAGPPDDPSLVFANEVVGLTFSYFDGNAWQDSWDGTTVGPDGQTPIGAPVAIAINLTIASPDAQNPKTYRRVVPLATANGILPSGSTATTGTTTSGSSTSSTTGP
jgi:prepilin-type N-terminal cleavage/methylation domain-containing protein